jgi:hypothetical protein
MELPHPHSWRVADRSLSTDEKHAIVDAYAQIHARGVLHGDVALRHILIGMSVRQSFHCFLTRPALGRDGKPTIINFRRASCLRPAMKIGLGGCSTHEFQLEMRQVKFLLDYQGAREFEYQLARRCRSATGMDAREGPTLVAPVGLVPYDCTMIADTNMCISFPYMRSLSESGMRVRLKTYPHLHFPFIFPALQTSRCIPYHGFQAICRCVWTTSILILGRTTASRHPLQTLPPPASKGNSQNMTAIRTSWITPLLTNVNDSARHRAQRERRETFLIPVTSFWIRNRSAIWLGVARLRGTTLSLILTRRTWSHASQINYHRRYH